MAPYRLFIGTYTRAGSKGIYALRFDGITGKLSGITVAAETSNPSYLALSPDRAKLYAVSESDALAIAFLIEADRTRLKRLPGHQAAGGIAPCHLSTDHTGRTLVTVNYHTGVVAALPIAPDGSLGPAVTVIQHHGSSVNPDRQSTAHAHSVTLSPDNRFALVCDLGLDKVFSYRIDPATATLTAGTPPFTVTSPGSGPRHFAFSPDGNFAFVVAEMGATVTSYRYGAEGGTLTPVDTQSTLPAGFTGENKSAAIRVHPNGQFVYASNRGPDSIAVFRVNPNSGQLSLIELVPSGGKGPRDITLSPEGKWLIAANQDSDSLNVLQVDPVSGRLTPTSSSQTLSMPVCVLFAD